MSKRGQLAVPAEIRRKFDLHDNQAFEWLVEDGIIRLVPLPKDPVAALDRCLNGLPLLTSLLAERKNDRERNK